MIPTKEIKIGSGEEVRKIKVYEYLTQTEEDRRLEIISGGREMEYRGDEVVFKAALSDVANARNYLIEALCVDLTKEEVDIMKPSLRKELFSQLEAIVESTKKE